MLATSERSSASFARSRAARSPAATRAASTSGSNGTRITSSAPASSAARSSSGESSAAQRTMCADGELARAARTAARQRRRPAARRDHDLRAHAARSVADRLAVARDVHDSKPGGGQDAPRVVADILESEQHHARADPGNVFQSRQRTRLRIDPAHRPTLSAFPGRNHCSPRYSRIMGQPGPTQTQPFGPAAGRAGLGSGIGGGGRRGARGLDRRGRGRRGRADRRGAVRAGRGVHQHEPRAPPRSSRCGSASSRARC